jgi:hypothetical protein
MLTCASACKNALHYSARLGHSLLPCTSGTSGEKEKKKETKLAIQASKATNFTDW